jgi:hypothetical protein
MGTDIVTIGKDFGGVPSPQMTDQLSDASKYPAIAGDRFGGALCLVLRKI